METTIQQDKYTISDTDKKILQLEHSLLKSSLNELVDFINSNEYYKLSDNYRKAIDNQKALTEMLLNTISMIIFGDPDRAVVPNLGIASMFANAFSYNGFDSLSSFSAESIKQNKADKEV